MFWGGRANGTAISSIRQAVKAKSNFDELRKSASNITRQVPSFSPLLTRSSFSFFLYYLHLEFTSHALPHASPPYTYTYTSHCTVLHYTPAHTSARAVSSPPQIFTTPHSRSTTAPGHHPPLTTHHSPRASVYGSIALFDIACLCQRHVRDYWKLPLNRTGLRYLRAVALLILVPAVCARGPSCLVVTEFSEVAHISQVNLQHQILFGRRLQSSSSPEYQRERSSLRRISGTFHNIMISNPKISFQKVARHGDENPR